MFELSLFTGAGGGVLGTKLLGFRHVGYVEWNEYCQRLLRQRIDDGILDEAPIFCDVRAFIRDGYAEGYKGLVDIITAGFPCQPFSVAGKQAGEDDPRNMWPSTIECLRIIRPRYALLENVPGLLAHRYIQRIFRELAESGYDAKWACLDARTQGGPIERERVFIACTDKVHGEEGLGSVENGQTEVFQGAGRQCPTFWLQTPSTDIGMGNGVADYMDRVEAIGNGQVPIVAASAWRLLS